ncbi:hypothetical protein J2T60_002375 [Natronospira proteinivora]|uniref:NHL repeat-containing protein n=1 Tax=Natronospira proteinivora TaxID=1807133 RepID=A0ABT1GAL9_9GAMM|nr:NHL repeat-containing protein [Natronospira proteinivora]MCP1728375.1 hypothetical protein [Natronospira proteinivora]
MPTVIKLLLISLAWLLLAGSDGCPFDLDGLIDDTGGGTDGLTHAEAEWVVGQPDFTSGTTGRSADADTLNDPVGLTLASNRLFVADFANNRVMVYQPVPDTNNETAAFVLGQPDFTESERNRADEGMARPQGLLARSWGLVLADSDNHRVLLWDSLPGSGNVSPDRAFGQPDVASDLGSACTDDGLNQPWGLSLSDDRLVVADHGNHRLMIWDRNDPSGQPAAGVLGQFDAFSCNANGGEGVPAGDTFNRPAGIWSDGNRLAVADQNNNRVLLWDSFPDAGEPADRVLGQADFSSRNRNAGDLERGMNAPSDVFWANGRLFVADQDNHRILVYSGWPTGDHVRPDAVIGQPDRNSSQANNTGDENTINARSLRRPETVWADDSRLIVSDTGNDRVLMFSLDN